jgi:hypothetical protein
MTASYTSRKVAVFPVLPTLPTSATFHVHRPTDAFIYDATPTVLSDAAGVAGERADRIAADQQLAANIATETTQRQNADAALSSDIGTEILARIDGDNALQVSLVNETGARIDGDDSLAIDITNEATARIAGDTVAHWAGLDFSSLPTSDPGNGQPWLSNGNLHVGP